MKRPLRLLCAASAFVLAGAILVRCQTGHSRLAMLRAEVLPRLSGDLAAATGAALDREPDLAAAQALAARALLADTLRRASQPGTVRRASLVETLEQAEGLASHALAARPASWVAALARGGAVYLGRSLARDSRLLTEPAAWEGSLERAQALAPGQVEAQRWLALAYLELWAFLPDAKKAHTRELVSIGLADPTTFDRIIQPWLTIAKDHATAHALMPPAPFAWERLAQIYGHDRDWVGYASAREGHLRAIASTAGATVDAAERYLEGGDPRAARPLFLQALTSIPVDGRFADLLARILARLPGGPVDAASETVMRRWLDWTLEGASLANRALPAEAVGRLQGVVAELPPATAALAAVLADDLPRAEQIERRKSALGGDAWSRYFLAKARNRLSHADREGAAAALAQMPLALEPSLAELLLRRELARTGSDASEQQRAAASFLAQQRDTWGPVDWRMSGHSATITLLPSRPASKLVLEILERPSEGGALAVRLDGTTVTFLPVAPGQSTLTLELPLSTDVHRVELQAYANQPVRPGATRLAG